MSISHHKCAALAVFLAAIWHVNFAHRAVAAAFSIGPTSVTCSATPPQSSVIGDYVPGALPDTPPSGGGGSEPDPPGRPNARP